MNEQIQRMPNNEIRVGKSLISLTPKIEAYEANLNQSKTEIQSFIKTSEGLLFKFIGLDGLIGLVPVAGAIYTAFGGFWLLSQASRLRADFSEKSTIVFLTVVDICIGFFPVGGDLIDLFFRVHAWNGKRLLNRANIQLSMIDRARDQIAQGLNPDLSQLEDVLFRDGGTKGEQVLKYAMIIGVLLLLFVVFVID